MVIVNVWFLVWALLRLMNYIYNLGNLIKGGEYKVSSVTITMLIIFLIELALVYKAVKVGV